MILVITRMNVLSEKRLELKIRVAYQQTRQTYGPERLQWD